MIRDQYHALGDPPRSSSDPTKLSNAAEQLIFSGILTSDFKFRSGEHNRFVLERYILRPPGHGERRWLDKAADVGQLDRATRARNKPLIGAWLRLRKSLTEWLSTRTNEIDELRKLEEMLYKRVQLAVLDVKQLEDAFLLFETLNDRGLQLSAADLLKSHLLGRLDANHPGEPAVLDDATDRWDDLITDLGGGDISGFLRHYLLADHPRVRKTDVFPFFKDQVTERGPDIALDELVTMGSLYKDFLFPNDATDIALRGVLANLQGTGIDTMRVALLPARRWAASSREFERFARVAEILAFRWVVTGGNAQVLETIFQEAATMIKKSVDPSGVAQKLNDAEQKLISQSSVRCCVP